MTKIRKVLSVLILSVFLAALGTNSFAYGDPIGPGSQDLNPDSKAVLESIEMINSIGKPDNPILLKLKGTGISSAKAWFLLEDNHDQGIPMEFQLKDGEWVAEHPIYMEGIRGEYYLSHIDLTDDEHVGRSYYNSDRYTLEQFDARYKHNVYYAEPKDFSVNNIQVTGVYGGYNPEIEILVDNDQLKVNDTLSVTVEVDESDVKIDTVFVTYQLDDSEFRFSMVLSRGQDGKFTGTRKIAEYHKNGTFRMQYVNLSKGEGAQEEMVAEISHNVDPMRYKIAQDLSAGSFTVTGGKEDNTAPVFVSFKEKEMTATPGEVTNFEVSLIEEESLMNFGHISFLNEKGQEVFGVMSFEGDKAYIKIDTPAKYINLGTYRIFRFVLEDNAGNKNLYFNSELNEFRDDVVMLDLSGYTLTYIEKAKPDAKIRKIEIRNLPETYYFPGENLNLEKMVIEGIYENGDRVVLDVTADHITGYNKNLIGQQTLTIKYGNLETTFVVLVKDPSLKISISGKTAGNAALNLDQKDLDQFDIPEVLDPSVKSVEIRLNAEVMTKSDIDEVNEKSKDLSKVLALYDLSLVKMIEKADGTIEEKNLIDDSFKGFVTLSIEVPEEFMDIEELSAIYVSEDGSIQLLETESRTVDGKRYLYFQTNHFSLYGIAQVNVPVKEVDTEDKEEVADVPEAVEKDTLPKAGLASHTSITIMGISSVLGGLELLRRKKKALIK